MPGRLTRTRAGYLLSVLKFRGPVGTFPLTHRVFAVWRSLDEPESAWPITLAAVLPMPKPRDW